uniref:NADH-ubiquinone oxidoreductase chain 5 n=1 Tax=Bematistes alcinoe TaxID=502015 RepID=A0A140CVG2_9NEOP|nr:NADH dehydrogenase subunit 5 [Bematistes alcinoe]AMJ17286.1 NADH dehydrogenase subunit 5 [Bematistes alcinoe]
MKKYSMFFIWFVFLFGLNLLFFMMFLYLKMMDLILFLEWEVFFFNSSVVVMTILLDWMSLLFMMFVLLISSSVIYYSGSYMKSELNKVRFVYLVLMFVFSMMLMIISPNMISILLGWDGLGLVSYCLVIFYQNVKSYNAGMLTALSNRIGDVMILLLISWMLNYGSWNYIYYLDFMGSEISMQIIGLLVIIASMTKSAQIPFSSWLPAAMSAPTPVSALVHSSTLVTAGVYLMIRFNSLLVELFFMKFFMLLFGLTMLMAGISANFEFDLKKIIALSTLSQLGLMMSILSMGFSDLAFFHLLTHAMFKALLFLCAGVAIHFMNNSQDIRNMGGISIFIPITSLCMNISNLSLCGIPFLSGFYSKDLILEMVGMSNFNFFIMCLYFVSTGLTMFYTVRLLMYLMLNEYNLMSIYNLYEEDYFMLKSMVLLLFMSLVSGSFLGWMIFCYPYMVYLPSLLKFMVFYVMGIGFFLGYFISDMNLYSVNKFKETYNLSYFLTNMWFLPEMFVYGVNFHYLSYSQKLMKNMDLGWIEYYSGFGIFYIMKNNSIIIEMLQKNNFKIYLMMFILWMMVMISISFV